MLLLMVVQELVLLAAIPPLELAAYDDDWGDSDGDRRWSGLRQTSDLTCKQTNKKYG